jgi:hypothetical protein
MSREISCAPIWSLIRIKILFTKPQLNTASPGLPPTNLDQINHNVRNPEAFLSPIALNEKPPIGLTLTESYYPLNNQCSLISDVPMAQLGILAAWRRILEWGKGKVVTKRRRNPPAISPSFERLFQ